MVVFLHEAGAVERLIGIVVEEAGKAEIVPTSVVVEIGSLSSYSKDSIVFYFDLMKKDYSLIEDCLIEVNVVMAKIKCKDCRAISEVSDKMAFFCPECDSMNVVVMSGRDFVVKKINGNQRVR